MKVARYWRRRRKLEKFQDRCERLAGRTTDHVLLRSFLRIVGNTERQTVWARRHWQRHHRNRKLFLFPPGLSDYRGRGLE